VIPSERYIATGERPSYKELGKKLMVAAALVATDNWVPVNPGHLQENWEEMAQEFGIDVETAEDQKKILAAAFGEVRPEHYIGDNPPDTAKELVVAGLDLFVFRWQSKLPLFKNSVMYLKFSIIGKGERGPVYVHSIHLNHPS
jgi:hypothetical protein